MAGKKKALIKVQLVDPIVESVIAEFVECPQHVGFSLPVKVEGNRAYAVCHCNVRNNMWRGRVVWETTADIKAEKPVEETPAITFEGEEENG